MLTPEATLERGQISSYSAPIFPHENNEDIILSQLRSLPDKDECNNYSNR